MLKQFLPDEHVKSVLDIKPEHLKEKGIKGVITDLDNTLVAWDREDVTPELEDWFQQMKAAGIKITIVSNNKLSRVRAFSNLAELPYIFRARKPLRRAFRQAIRKMGLIQDEVAVIGDQLITDIWGGNRAGAHTVLVVPIASSDGWATKLNRQMERFLFSAMRRRGWINWED